MTTLDQSSEARPVSSTRATTRRRPAGRGSRRWGTSAALLIITVIVLIPLGVILLLSVQPSSSSSTTSAFTLENFAFVFGQTDVLRWLGNSLGVTLATVVVSVIVAAPAGYVLSRGRSRAVQGYSLLLFVVQSLPIITSIIPLFILFAQFGLSDSLVGLTVVYVGSTVAVATWMMAAYIDTIPITLEEASWVDGASMFGSFLRIVMRNSLPGVLSTAIFSFLLAWNDFLVALIFLRSSEHFTLPIGLETFFQQNSANWGAIMAVSVVMLLPPAILFATLNRYFSVGGIGGSLAGR